MQRADKGTRCSRPALIRVPGIVHNLPPRSISSHLAPITSLVRVVVNRRNSNASFVASFASVSRIV